MNILIGCEFSGVVREEFRKRGHNAWSCDLLPSEIPSEYHIQGDILKLIYDGYWDMMIVFPPCTHLCCSGARWFKYKQREQQFALSFIKLLMNAPIEKIALENPVGVISTRIRKPDQIIQPYQFGHPETKTTCLWLKNLPKLIPTKIVKSEGNKLWRMKGIEKCKLERGQIRSITYKGIAKAMAEQWG